MKEFVANAKIMGSAFQLAVVASSEENANKYLQMGINEIKRIEHLLSEFLPDSETSRINKQAAFENIKIDKECFDLIQRCHAISSLTKGDFDITVSPLKKLYRFKNEDFEMPSKELIRETLSAVGFQKIHLNKEESSIQYQNKEMKIGFAAIGKGYASDMVKKMWLQNGVNSGYINASGDLNAFGQKADHSPWKIAIANPDDKEKMLLYVPLNNASVATSGDYEQHFLYRGKRYSHNIDPHTGLPLTGIKSVTVFSPGAELSDALATAVYVKGAKKGIDFIDQMPQTHCIIIDDENKIHFSKNLEYEAV
jgi:thiamine biosynthesis lipoprotein